MTSGCSLTIKVIRLRQGLSRIFPLLAYHPDYSMGAKFIGVPRRLTSRVKNHPALPVGRLRSISMLLGIMAISGSVLSHHPAHSLSGAFGKIRRPLTVQHDALANRVRSERLSETVQRLAGKYATLVIHAAHHVHISPVLVAAVIHVENGGNLQGSAHRVSDAGAIGVMQLMPVTAWDVLHVNPWNPRQNIDGGARFLARLLHRFHGNIRLALMAYNAGPTWIAQGGRPQAAVWYARQVMRAERI